MSNDADSSTVATQFLRLFQNLWTGVSKRAANIDTTEDLREHGAIVFEEFWRGCQSELQLSAADVWDQLTDDLNQWGDNTIRAVPAGRISYQLRRPLRSSTAQLADGCEFRVESLSPRFLGRGQTPIGAKRRFRDAVHIAFQTLVSLRPFQMNPEQANCWRLLQDVIDVSRYEKSCPIVMTQVGRFRCLSDSSFRLDWIHRSNAEDVILDTLPPRMAAFHDGQWFEAVVERRPASQELVRVVCPEPLDPPCELSEEQVHQWLSTLPSSENVPKSDVDWKTL